MKLLDFKAFQKIMKLLSHDKIIFHPLFGAFEMPHFMIPLISAHKVKILE